MTTIAYDGKTICADTLATWGDERALMAVEKIRREPTGIYAICGAFSVFHDVIHWIEQGASYTDAPKLVGDDEWRVIYINVDGEAFCAMSSSPGLVQIAPPFAIGSGGEFALGAMLAGKSAEEAVKIAAIVDIRTGDQVQVVHLK